eukprot:3977057-Prymnesium_polylepis.1
MNEGGRCRLGGNGGGRESAGVREGIYVGCRTAGDAVRGAVVPRPRVVGRLVASRRVRLARSFVVLGGLWPMVRRKAVLGRYASCGASGT